MTWTHAPNAPEHDVLIIGTGFAGLGAAIQLGKAGFHNLVLIEKEPDLGGTWFVNTYPGCACDIESHMYSFSFEPNPGWSRDFAPQSEILAYMRRVADKYRLRDKTRFGSQVVSLRYDEQHCFWRVEIAEAERVRAFMEQHGLKPGDALPREAADFPATTTLTARIVVAGMGGLSTPAYPALPGLSRFRGKTFHSQRWDHDYDLTGKRVAVIGTGASAIQFVPAIQPHVAQLDVYQRTPPWIFPKGDRPISAARRRLFGLVPPLRLLRRLELYLKLELRAVAFVLRPQLLEHVARRALRYLESEVADPVLREKLTPSYAVGCKRVLLTDDWYAALQKANVELVTDGIAEVREHAIVDAAGVERPVDCMIYGTGFRIADVVPRGLVFGRGGRDVTTIWQRGPEAYRGTTVSGCPNFFIMAGPNTGLGHNSIIYMIESQLRYLVDALRWMKRENVGEIEVKAGAQTKFNAGISDRSRGTVWESGGCASYYLDPVTGRNFTIWPDFTFRFRALMRHFDPEHYARRAASGPVFGR